MLKHNFDQITVFAYTATDNSDVIFCIFGMFFPNKPLKLLIIVLLMAVIIYLVFRM